MDNSANRNVSEAIPDRDPDIDHPISVLDPQRVDATDKSIAGAPLPTKLCVVVSLVRHAESWANRHKRCMDEPDPLTPTGCIQAEALGKEWSKVHVDHLYSSTLKRAVDTAREISTHNVGHPEIEQRAALVEHRWGKTALDYSRSGYHDAAMRALTGGYSPINRKYRPSGGGESYNDVAIRGKTFLLTEILGKFGAPVSQAPKSLREKEKALTAESLPEGIPHVVVVSHNIFLTELYEGLLCWGKEHEMMNYCWNNAGWTRHILCYDTETGELESSDMRSPGRDYYY